MNRSYTEFHVPFAEFVGSGFVDKTPPALRFVTLYEVKETETQGAVKALTPDSNRGHRIAIFKNVVYWTQALRGTPLEEVSIYANKVSAAHANQYWDSDLEDGGRNHLLTFKLNAQLTFRLAEVLYLFGFVTERQLTQHLHYARQIERNRRTEQQAADNAEEFLRIATLIGPDEAEKLVRKVVANFYSSKSNDSSK